MSADHAPASRIAAAIAEQTGLEVDVSALKDAGPMTMELTKVSFWQAVEALAQRTNSRVVLGTKGKPVALVPIGESVRNPVSLDGAFRVALREVEARLDLQAPKAIYDLTFEIAWEARLPVFRMDGYPRITKGANDTGGPVNVKGYEARVAVAGTSHLARIAVTGLSRENKHIAQLDGVFTVTVADEMLRFLFEEVTAPATIKHKGVEVDLRRFVKKGSYWVAELHLHYPPESALFESFETYWLSRNRFTLIAPDGKARYVSDDVEINGSALVYRFKESTEFKPDSLKGWKIEYETPGPMREVPLKFEFKGVRLP